MTQQPATPPSQPDQDHQLAAALSVLARRMFQLCQAAGIGATEFCPCDPDTGEEYGCLLTISLDPELTSRIKPIWTAHREEMFDSNGLEATVQFEEVDQAEQSRGWQN